MADKKREEMNLYQKIVAVMDEIEYLKKDDQIAFGSSKYKAMSEEKVTAVVRAKLIKYGLAIFPVSQRTFKEGNLTSTNTEYKLVNVDNPGEYEILASSGQGADTQDKGVGKAMTYSYKYLLLRTFAIPTGEDPDKISSEELTAQFENEKEMAEKITPEQAGELKDMMIKANVDAERVLEYIFKKFSKKVKTIDELNKEEWAAAVLKVGNLIEE